MDICTTLGIHIKPHVKHSSLIFGTVVGLSHCHMGHMGVSAAISPLLTQVFNPYAGHPEHWLPTGWATHPNNDNISWIGKPNSVWSDVDLENRNNIPTDNQFDPSSHGKNQTVFETSQHLPTPLRHWHGHYFCNPNPNRRLRALCSHLTRSYHSWNLPWVEICCLHWSSSMIEIAVCCAAAICYHDNTRLARVLLYVNIFASSRDGSGNSSHESRRIRHFSRHEKNSHIRRHPAVLDRHCHVQELVELCWTYQWKKCVPYF